MSHDSEHDPDRLDGWKDIASYLGRSVRTAIRWQALGLPVRRVHGEKGETVYAFRSDVDAWLKSNPPGLSAPDANSARASDAPQSAPPPAEPQPAEAPRPRRSRLALGFTSAAGVIGALALAWLLAGSGWNPLRASGPITAWRVEDDALVGVYASGRRAWRHSFGVEINEDVYAKPARALDERLVTIADLDANGRPVILARVSGPSQDAQSTFYCFNNDGSVRFIHRFDGRIQFGSTWFLPPFPVTRYIVDDLEPTRSVIVVAQHNLEFPALVERRTASGAVVQRHWANGHLSVIAPGRLDGRHVLFVGGISNEHMRPSLAVIGTTGDTYAPSADRNHACTTCDGLPARQFIVFSTSRLAERIGALPSVTDVRPRADGGIVVTVRHHGNNTLPGDTDPAEAMAHYELDASLRLIRATRGDDFKRTLQRAVSIGILTEAEAADEEKRLELVVSWSGAKFVPIERQRP